MKNKGQWFLISAVIASSAFLGISLLVKDYFAVDTSSAAKINNGFYFQSISQQLDNILKNTVVNDSPVCINLTTNLDEFRAVAEKAMAAKGLFFDMNYTIKNCSSKKVNFNFLLASQSETLYNFSTAKSASEVIG